MKFPYEQTAKSETARFRSKRTGTRARSSLASSRPFAAALLAAAALFGLSACKSKKHPHEHDPPPRDGQTSEPPEATESPSDPARGIRKQTFADFADRCTLGHSGIVLDAGHPSSESLRLFRLVDEKPTELVTRQGESFRRLDQMSTDFVFWLTEEMKDFEVQARVHGLSSERMAVFVDETRVGAAPLLADKSHTFTISAGERSLAPGRHKLSLNLSRPRQTAPSADVSWIRLGAHLDDPANSPATRREIFSEVTIDKTRLPAILLRPSGSLRCPVWVPERTSFEARFGIWGEGAGEVEVIVHTADGGRFVVASATRTAEEPRAFSPITADLTRFASQFVDIELSAPHSLKRARLALGEPALTSRLAELTHAPRAKRVVIVVLSGLSEKHSPPLAAAQGLPALNQLARDAVTFTNYRASSTSTPAVMSSLLLGLAPWEHGVEGIEHMLSPGLVPLASIIEASTGRSSFFTGVPFSFAPFGFDRGFELFESVAPQEDRAATEPLALAKKWLGTALDHTGPVLSLIHLRGGHPPFDITKEAAVELPPAEYGGELSPRRAALQLAEVRGRARESNRSMPEEDWRRLETMQKASLLKQSAALSDLLGWLRQRNAYDDTLILVMGDVGAGERPHIPFSENAPLEESYLASPLLIKFPHGYLRGTRSPGLFATRDLTLTVLNSLGLAPAQASDAIDLGGSDAEARALLRPHMAYREGQFSMRVGDILLRGSNGNAPTLCRPALDPDCNIDRSADEILEARALWFSAWHILSAPLSVQKDRTPIKKDPVHENALTVWGVVP